MPRYQNIRCSYTACSNLSDLVPSPFTNWKGRGNLISGISTIDHELMREKEFFLSLHLLLLCIRIEHCFSIYHPISLPKTKMSIIAWQSLFIAEISCGALCNPKNGHVNISSGAFGLVAKYDCDNGYVLQGSNESKCCSGQWTTAEPHCGKK